MNQSDIEDGPKGPEEYVKLCERFGQWAKELDGHRTWARVAADQLSVICVPLALAVSDAGAVGAVVSGGVAPPETGVWRSVWISVGVSARL